GVALVVAAIGALASLRGARIAPGEARKALALALATGLVIGTYSLVDGIGVRHSGSAAGYAAWLMFIHGPLLIAACFVLGGGALRRALRHSSMRTFALGIGGGLLSTAAYAIVLWAQDRSSLAMVSALRETSVLFAGVIGAMVFA